MINYPQKRVVYLEFEPFCPCRAAGPQNTAYCNMANPWETNSAEQESAFYTSGRHTEKGRLL